MEKDIVKDIISIAFIVFLLEVLLFYFLFSEIEKVESRCKEMNSTVKAVILTQSKNDSLFMVHYSKCSFISLDRIKIDNRGYLKIKTPTEK